MLWVMLGFVALVLVLLTANRLATVDPRVLAQGVRWGGVAAVAAASLFLLRSGRLAFFFLPALQRLMRQVFANATSARPASHFGSAPRESVVTTRTVRMRLDHGADTLDGDVLAGRFRGRRLGELAVPDVLLLLDECRADDTETVPLLEAYLDRREPDWREAASRRAEESSPRNSTVMSREEALAVLGLEEGATPDDIRAAHHRLMKRLHPDQGGTTFLATQVNQAKDVLLRG
jgi:hypothetical protein